LIPNLDDGNQIMWQLLKDDIVASPSLSPVKGWMQLPDKAGLGCTLDKNILQSAKDNFLALSN